MSKKLGRREKRKRKKKKKKKIGVRMVDRVRKGKINAGGSRRTPRKFDFLATPDVSIRSFSFFFFSLLPFFRTDRKQ